MGIVPYGGRTLELDHADYEDRIVSWPLRLRPPRRSGEGEPLSTVDEGLSEGTPFPAEGFSFQRSKNR